MGKRTKWLLSIGVIAALVMGFQIAAFAAHPEESLTGSDFEIDTDANLKVDDPAPSIDWANVDPDVQTDDAPGQNDDSFGQGTKEDTPVPTVTAGGIPNNKSDLTTFGVYLEENATSGKDFLTVFWHRVQDPTGTTNMDFEFNQSETISTNGVTPVRTAGDILIQYDLASGGDSPELFVSKWVATGNKSLCEAANSTPCWGDRINLTDSGDAAGSINTSPIPLAEANIGTTPVTNLGAISPRTFGEAHIDMDALVPEGGGDICNLFGSAYLKSRSSDSFTAALKDFIAPKNIDIGQCGTVKVIKNDDATPGNPLDDAEFDLVKDNEPFGTPVGTQTEPGAEDIGTAQTPIPPVDSCVTVAGECEFGDVQEGEYWVIETLAPPGYDLADPAFQHVTVTADGTVTVTFVNPRVVSTLATAPSVIPNDTATVGTDGETGTYTGTLTFELFDSLTECTADDNDANAVYSEEVPVPAATAPGTEFSTDNPGVPSAPGENNGYTIDSGNDTTYYWQVTYVDDVRDGAVSDCVESTLVTITDDNGGTV